MGKIINSEASAYPASNTSELSAVITFNSLLDLSRIKPFINTLDKVPNTDGHIEIVTESQVSMGKLEVQIKALDKKNKQTPKYQCSKEFLAYCEENTTPVLLIVVDAEDKIAYWHNINRSLISDLSKKLKKESVNLDFEKNNCVSNTHKDYLDKWINILKEHRTKVFDYDILNARKEQLEKELNELKEYTNYSIGKKDPVYSEIHIFLDFYNGLLENDFKTIKNILYPDYWKIGLGYGFYKPTSVNFMLFPILYDVNDILIKKFKSEHIFRMNGALKIIGHNGDNPIKTKPEKYAYELIEGDIKDAFKDQPLIVKNIFLAKEYVFAFIDRFHSILGLEPNQQEYSVFDIEYSFYRFLPFFISQNVYVPEKMKGQLLSFDIDNFYHHYQAEPLLKAVAQAKKSLRKQPSLEIPKVYLITKEFNIDVLLVLLGHLKEEKVKRIKREYDVKNIIKDRIYFSWEAWSEKSILKNLKLFYSNFSHIYDAIIATYFPNLIGELQFYNDFNLLVIVVDFERKSEMQEIGIDYFYLKSNDVKITKTIVFNSKDTDIPIRRNTARTVFVSGLTFEDNLYKLKYQNGSFLKFLFDKTPILTATTKLLNERLTKYFEKKKSI